MLQLTFNPGLTLTGFRTTRPRSLSNYLHIKIITQLCNKMMTLNGRLKIDLILMQEQHSETEKHFYV